MSRHADRAALPDTPLSLSLDFEMPSEDSPQHGGYRSCVRLELCSRAQLGVMGRQSEFQHSFAVVKQNDGRHREGKILAQRWMEKEWTHKLLGPLPKLAKDGIFWECCAMVYC